MNDLNKDILVGSLFIAGILSFLSGLFIISTVVFGATTMVSNMAGRAQLES